MAVWGRVGVCGWSRPEVEWEGEWPASWGLVMCFSECWGWPTDCQVGRTATVLQVRTGAWEGWSDGVCPEARWAACALSGAGAPGCPPV